MLRFPTKRRSSFKHKPFCVPTPDPFQNPMVETHPRQLRQWVAALPSADPEQLAQAIITQLGRLNRFPALVKKRAELMEIYRAPSTRLYQLSQERKSTLPMSLVRQVMLEMAYGHLHLVNQTINEKPSAKRRKRLQTAVFHAAEYLSREYLYACLMYDCSGSITLREIIRLHTLTEEYNLQPEPVARPEQSTTIAHHVKLTLLLSLLDPCHLQDGEARILFDYLSEFADLACFTELNNPSEAAGHYVIDRIGKLPPQPFDPDKREGLTPPRFCLFNILPISQRLHQDLRNIEKQVGVYPIGLQNLGSKSAANLLQRTLKSWHVRQVRDSERHPTSGQARLSLGIAAIHHFLSYTEASSGSAIPTEEIVLLSTVEGLSASVSLPPRNLDCWRHNQSRTGIALLLPLPQETTPHVGDLVLLTKPDGGNRADAKIGIVRRALLKDKNTLKIGVQFISGRLVPLTLQTIEKADDQPSRSIQALYLDLGEVERSTLIVPKESLTIDREYRIEEMIPAPRICPVHLAEATASFERFRIRRT